MISIRKLSEQQNGGKTDISVAVNENLKSCPGIRYESIEEKKVIKIIKEIKEKKGQASLQKQEAIEKKKLLGRHSSSARQSIHFIYLQNKELCCINGVGRGKILFLLFLSFLHTVKS